MAHYRLAIARFWHESNSFSGIPTQIRDFEQYQGGTLIGSQLLEHTERRDEVAGMVEVFSGRDDTEMVPLISAGALPAGLISQDTVDHLEQQLLSQLLPAGKLDGVCIALHGSMSAEQTPDLDGYFLQVLRSHVGPEVPIVVALDCHAIVTQQMVELANALIAYRTHPHTDLVETGARCAQVLMDTVHGRIHPLTRARRVPLILPPPDDGTTADPLKKVFNTFIGWDDLEGVIACSMCPAFPFQNVSEQGSMALAVTDGDADLANRLVDDLAGLFWDVRHELLPDPMLSPAKALEHAATIEGAPVVITDSADTVGGGAPGDNTCILDAVLAHRHTINGLILLHLPDADAVEQLKNVQVGQTATVAVGGKRDRVFCQPLTVTGEMLCVSSGPIQDDAAAGFQETIETGPILCLGIDNVRLVLTERVILGPQPSVFRAVGIEPFEAKVVVLKTGIGYKMTYAHVAKSVLRADCPGAQSYNLKNYLFEHVARPIFPLDGEFDWNP